MCCLLCGWCMMFPLVRVYSSIHLVMALSYTLYMVFLCASVVQYSILLGFVGLYKVHASCANVVLSCVLFSLLNRCRLPCKLSRSLSHLLSYHPMCGLLSNRQLIVSVT